MSRQVPTRKVTAAEARAYLVKAEDRVRARRGSSVRGGTSSRSGDSLRADRETGGGVTMSSRAVPAGGRFLGRVPPETHRQLVV